MTYLLACDRDPIHETDCSGKIGVEACFDGNELAAGMIFGNMLVKPQNCLRLCRRSERIAGIEHLQRLGRIDAEHPAARSRIVTGMLRGLTPLSIFAKPRAFAWFAVPLSCE